MKTSVKERRAIVDKANNQISISRQCNLLDIYKSGYYYEPSRDSELNLKLMQLIDKQYMKYPFMGVPSMTQWIKLDIGLKINKKRVERLYKLMGIHAIVPGPHTSKSCKEHKKYPYLLRDVKIKEKNQVWAIDITYVPVKSGYMYLIAIIDLYSRYVVGWSLSNTMEAQWCVETVKEAIKKHGKPEIINTDQGSQFTGELYISYLKDQKIQISMDGKGRAIDNIFIERLWRSVKYEDIYLNCYETSLELYQGLKQYFVFYNCKRRHSSLNYRKPKDVYIAA